MLFGVIVEAAVGALCIIFGLLVWKKQKFSLLHDYHYKNVKKEDLSAYTRMMGIGLILIGAGICLTGIISLFTQSAVNLTALAAGLISGIIIMGKAQKKYNGSWLG